MATAVRSKSKKKKAKSKDEATSDLLEDEESKECFECPAPGVSDSPFKEGKIKSSSLMRHGEPEAAVEETETLIQAEEEGPVSTFISYINEVDPMTPTASAPLLPEELAVSEPLVSVEEETDLPPQAFDCLVSLRDTDQEFEEMTKLVIEDEQKGVPFTESQLHSVYKNDELESYSEAVEKFLEAEVHGSVILQHPLYNLIMKYISARDRSTVNLNELEALLNECKELQNRLWALETATIVESGECNDGNPVQASHDYPIARFDRMRLSTLTKKLATVREVVYNHQSFYSYTCELCKIQIDHYIYEISSYFSFLAHNAPVVLSAEPPPRHIWELRSAISVLFYFVRKPLSDLKFIEDIRSWLTKLVSILLRVASWNDHTFLLNHILRCPSGVSKWAVSYVQAPPPPFNASNILDYLNHMIVVLAAIILPVKDRHLFLTEMNQSTVDQDDPWVIVDSDGEDDDDSNPSKLHLGEHDVIAFLNQVPLDFLFRHILNITRRDEADNFGNLSNNEILRIFAIVKVLLRVLEQGLIHYELSRHQQFTKRVASIVNHTIHYTTDAWEAFKRDSLESPESAFMTRLQIEYNSLVYTACLSLLKTPHKSSLQFLAVLPFSSVSLSMLWRIYNIVLQPNIKDSGGVVTSGFQWWTGVEELLPKLSDAELYYVLTSVTNMALARPYSDWTFIKVVTSHLLMIGFINTSTRDLCYKTCRTLLSNLTSKHPVLISVIVEKLKFIAPQAGNLSVYLFKDLPLNLWKPTTEDLGVLEYWLLSCAFGSIEGSLGRFIISNMQWGFNPDSSSDLFLKREIHCQMAQLIVRLASRYCPESVANSSSTAIVETVKQMAYMANSVGRCGSNEQQSLSDWVWKTLFKLRLHLLDQPERCVWATLANPTQWFSMLPTLETLPHELSHLLTGLKDKQVTAIYVALLITTEGHSVPLICQNGFPLINNLVQCNRYLAVLALLQHIIPLFLECPQSLLASDAFIHVISSLVTADKTFLKLAKNLVIPEFPGVVLKQFANMIQSHLENYRKYSLPSPTALAHLWLQVLSKVWSVEQTNVSFLMDVIFRVAFFRPDMKSMANDVLLGLFNNLSPTTKSVFSLGWGGGNPPTLMPRPSTPDTPWFALFALELEQSKLETDNFLWQTLLIELSTTTNKPNIDNALKNACSCLKIPSIASKHLMIYRWSQQALDTPVDHPLLPIFWQKFFYLYLARVPTAPDRPDFGLGCVGSKFFDGITNLNYFKKIKKKLKDCREFFENKCGSSPSMMSVEKKAWLNNIARLYTMYGLWLEEPILQEANLYLPSLPPQYDSQKLLKIFSQDYALWYEYLDYDEIRKSQKENIFQWEKSLARSGDVGYKQPIVINEQDPVARILKRLQSYDCPVPPPALRPPQQVCPLLPREAFTNKHLMLDILKPAFKCFVTFAQNHHISLAEANGIDCSFLEALPLLYRSVESEVKLYAACDTQGPRQQQPSPNALICAGPAVIRLQVCESRLNEATELTIKNNRNEMQAGLKRATHPPPTNVVGTSIQLVHAIEACEREWQELNRVGDVELLTALQEVGVHLFYYLASLLTEETSNYPPFKQQITIFLETLGQCFISGDERQGPMLLAAILERPSLSELVSTYFSPATSSPLIYLQLYRTLLNFPNSVPHDLIFVLHTKFEINQWLELKKPRPSDRSQLIELVGKALAKHGMNPPTESVMIHEVLRRHLCILMTYEAPQHYAEVLTVALRHSESHSLATEVWYDILNAITVTVGAKFRPHMTLAQVVTETTTFAIQQTMLSDQEIRDTASVLGTHFTNERLQYGLYGLYPKYRTYVSPFTSLFGLLSRACVVTTLQKHQSATPYKVCEELWPMVVNLFSPWLSPYYTQTLTQPTAAWIQQLTDDRSVLLPWIPGDSGHAHKMAAMFTETIRFVFDSLPGSGDICSFVWQFYVINFAHTSVKEYILSVIHSNLLSLPWNKFLPTMYDLDLMQKVSDTYVPYCHTFLGSIFIEIGWLSWIEKIPSDPVITAKIHCTLLHLLIKLANEPNVRQSGKILVLLKESQKFQWEFVDCANYEIVVNWYVMSYDPKVVLKLDETNEVDYGALELLKVAAGFTTSVKKFHESTPKKRQVYFRACIKLLVSCLSKCKPVFSSNRSRIETAVEDLLTQMDVVMSNTGSNYLEAGLLLSELLGTLNLPDGNPLRSIVESALVSWLTHRGPGSVIVAPALLRTLTTNVMNNAIVSALMEASLTCLFSVSSGGSDWNAVRTYLPDILPRHPPLEETMASNSHLLALYAVITKKIPKQTDLECEGSILESLIQWMRLIKHSELVESQMMLIFHLSLSLLARQCEHNANSCKFVDQIVDIAQSWAEFKCAKGILGAIGIRKPVSLSNRCRLVCRTLILLLVSQVPERKGELPVNDMPFIRCSPHAPGGITCNNMELGPSSETIKQLSILEGIVNDKSFADVKYAAQQAVHIIKLPETSMANAENVFLQIVCMLFEDRFLHVLKAK